MTLRGTFINGVVIPDAGQQLPEGMRVRFSPLAEGGRGRASATHTKKTTKKRGKTTVKRSRRDHPLTALAGIWKDRRDWKGKSSIEIVAELRRRPGEARD